jgi:threonine synthase
MREGQTGLVASVFIKEKTGLREFYIKNETQNPTWTFKDRGTVCSVHNAIKLGYKRISTLSSGNMGASVAAYGARSGMDTVIMLKENVPMEKIEALMVYGVRAIRLKGDYAGGYNKLLEIGNDHQIYYSISDDPFRVEGYKTLAFELFEQMQQMPDYLAVPLGSGGLFRGVLKGFEELEACGFIPKAPKMIGVQPGGNTCVVDAFDKGKDRIERVYDPETLDHVLENPYPPSGNQVLRKLKSNGGMLLKVDNEDVLEAISLLGHEGLFAQPASATCVAGVIHAVRNNKIPADSRVVAVVTGTGLKFPPVLKRYGFTPADVKIDELSDYLERS